MNEYLLTESEAPINVTGNGLYPKYVRDGQSLFHQVKSFGDDFVQSAFDLYNEKLLEDGDVPDVDDIICTLHADEIIEKHGEIILH